MSDTVVRRTPPQRAAAAFFAVLAPIVIHLSETLLGTSPPLAIMALFVAIAAWFGGVFIGWLAFLAIIALALRYGAIWTPGSSIEALLVFTVLSFSLLYGAAYAFSARHRESIAQVALREQQDLMRVLIDRLPVLVAYVDEQRRYVIHNRMYEEWFPERRIDGATLRELHGPEAYAQIEPLLARVFDGESVRSVDKVERNGQLRYLDVHYRPHVDASGHVRGVVALIQDITEHTNALETIRASEARLRSLAMASASIVWLADRDGLLIDAQGWPQFTGQTPEEYVGTGWLDALHPEDRNRVYDIWRRACDAQEPSASQYRLRVSDGSYRVVTASAIPIHDENGALAEWIGTVRDIDDQSQTEKALLERERERDALLENVPHMVWIADPDGNVLFNNTRWYEYTGLKPGDHWKMVTHQDDIERAIALWSHALRTGEPLVAEKRFRRVGDGEYRWHLVQGVPIRDQSGAITRWYGSSTDIEDQKRAIVTLAEANQRISRFLSILSHELRNPISGIVTACELLSRGDLEPQGRARALATMSRQSTHLERMIDDLLDISRVTQGIVELQREPCSMVHLLSDVNTDMETEASQKRVDLHFASTEDDVFVDGDPVRLRQIFMNLIANAIKASEPGSTVEISLRTVAHECEVWVTDQGPGLSPHVRSTLFEPFVQAETWRRKGLGLGLTIARQLAELHGGSIRAQNSEPCSGACFVVRLPLGGRNDHPRAPAVRAIPTSSPTSILVVDDERENAHTLQQLLELEGHRVEVATDAEMAMARWQEGQHTVVLCDLELSGPLDGFDVARALRMQVPRPYLIAYSGYGQPQDLINSRESGFDAHLVKPATLEQILSAIDKAS